MIQAIESAASGIATRMGSQAPFVAWIMVIGAAFAAFMLWKLVSIQEETIDDRIKKTTAVLSLVKAIENNADSLSKLADKAAQESFNINRLAQSHFALVDLLKLRFSVVDMNETKDRAKKDLFLKKIGESIKAVEELSKTTKLLIELPRPSNK